MKTQRLLPVLELALCCLFLFPDAPEAGQANRHIGAAGRHREH